MALNEQIKVSYPEHGCIKKRNGDKVYVYYATAVYRNEKGQPTADRVSIGKYDEESGMLIPNRNYYEVYLHTNQPVMVFQSFNLFDNMTVVENIMFAPMLLLKTP